jgi:hypothetical protein
MSRGRCSRPKLHVALDSEYAPPSGQVEQFEKLGVYPEPVALLTEQARHPEDDAFLSIRVAETGIEPRGQGLAQFQTSRAILGFHVSLSKE